MKEQIIHLEPHDDVVSVRDKLGWVRAPRVLLVLPDDSDERILRDRLDLVLILREATRRRAQLALITRDPVVIEQARDLGIACFPSIEASHRRYWRVARAPLIVERRAQDRRSTIARIEPSPRPDREGVTSLSQTRRGAGVTSLIVVFSLVLGGAYIVLPGATVHLTPTISRVTVTTTITADPAAEPGQVDIEHGLIAARRVGVEVESSVTVDATGTVLQPSQKARGIVLFTNLSPDQVTIPAGTVVSTSAAQPVRFVTLSDATLPGQIGETVEIPVEALEAGFTGNLPAGRINQVEGPLSALVAVTNPEPTYGGDAVSIAAIAQEDYDRARALLLQQLQQRAYAEMQSELIGEAEFIPPETLTVVLVHFETFSGYVGQAQERLNLAMRVTVQGIAVDERLARQVVYARLAEKVGEGFRIVPETLLFRRGEAIQFDEQQRVTLIMQGAGDISSTVDVAHVRRLVRGVSTQEAARRLNRELLLGAPPRIQTWPRFWPLMPVLPLRIQVEVESR